jgi:NADPH:quinone reductase-like Zn-dependent oxidoreductase
MRLFGFGLRAKNPLPRYDVAGRVDAVGAQLTALRTGDEVFGTCRGSFAGSVHHTAQRRSRPPSAAAFHGPGRQARTTAAS